MACSYNQKKTPALWPPAITSKQYGSYLVMVMRSEERMDRIFGSNWQQTEMPQGKVAATDLNVPTTNISNYAFLDLKNDSPITVLGKYKAVLTARAIQNRNLTPEIIISSPALRSVETAVALATYLKIYVAIEPGLSDLGMYNYSQLDKTFKIDTDYVPIVRKIPKNETREKIKSRLQTVLKILMNRQHDRPLFIVGHGLVQQMACQLADGNSMEELKETKDLDPVELGLRFPPGSIIAAVRSTNEPPLAYSIVKNLIPPLTYGDYFSNDTIPI